MGICIGGKEIGVGGRWWKLAGEVVCVCVGGGVGLVDQIGTRGEDYMGSENLEVTFSP